MLKAASEDSPATPLCTHSRTGRALVSGREYVFQPTCTGVECVRAQSSKFTSGSGRIRVFMMTVIASQLIARVAD